MRKRCWRNCADLLGPPGGPDEIVDERNICDSYDCEMQVYNQLVNSLRLEGSDK